MHTNINKDYFWMVYLECNLLHSNRKQMGLTLRESQLLSCVRLFVTWTVACQAPCPWNSPGQDTVVDSHSLLQGIFLTQRLIRGLLHCRLILHHLSHQEAQKSSKHQYCTLPHYLIHSLLNDFLWLEPSRRYFKSHSVLLSSR